MLYNHTTSLQGPTADNLTVQVELRNGPFRFLEQISTSVTVSLPRCITYIQLHSSQVLSDGIVTLQGEFSSFDPVLYVFFSNPDLSRGSVVYLETHDLQLILRSAREVRNAFPDQSACLHSRVPVHCNVASSLSPAYRH